MEEIEGSSYSFTSSQDTTEGNKHVEEISRVWNGKMVSACASAAEDEMLRKLYVDDLPQTGLQVKVVYRNPTGQVIARIPQEEESKALVRNISLAKR